MSNTTDKPFANRVAIVTGGASGIGAATAERLGGLGASVAIFDLDERGAERRAAELRAGDVDVTAYPVDVADEEVLREAVAQVARATGSVDLLVNCAASFISAGRDATRADWDRALGVNVRGYASAVSLA